MFDQTQDAALAEAARRVADPDLDPAELARIVAAFPSLAPAAASHPRLYPALAAWLGSLRQPDVDAALAARAVPGRGPAHPAPPAAPGPGVPAGLSAPAAPWAPAALAAPGAHAASAAPGVPGEGATPAAAGSFGFGPAAWAQPGSGTAPGGLAQRFAPPQPAPITPAPPGPRPRWQRAALIAGAGALALALAIAGASWVMRSRGLEAGAGGASGLQEQTGGAAGESAAGGATPAPDIAVAPVLGPAISTGALLGDGFERSTFEGFLGQATGLASGSNTPQAEAREGGDAAAGAGPLLELVGFDLDSGEAKWRLDPMAQFGLDPGVGVDRQFTFSDELGAMVLDQSGYAPDAPDAVLAVLDDTGEVVSETRIAPVERVIGFHGGTLVVGGEGRIAGYTATALGQPTWEAAYPGFERELFNPRTGTWLIFGAGGFIDALTGETLASGADIASAMYYLAEGDSDVLLRHDSETLEVTRVDLRTGAAVWDHGVEATQIVAVALVSGGVLMFDVLELGTGRGQVVGVDADSGEELWSQPGYGLRVLTGAGALTVASDFTDLAVRDLRTGAVLSQRALGEEERLMCAGWDIAYLADTGNQVTGLDLADGLADLWTVDLAGQLPTAEPGPIIPLATGGRLFAARLAEMDWLLGGSAATPESFLVELKGGA